MRISKKQTCRSCRALRIVSGHLDATCELGYSIAYNVHKTYVNMFIPGEPCPKPTHKDDLTVAKLTMRKVK
jgi:hypothetical protein